MCRTSLLIFLLFSVLYNSGHALPQNATSGDALRTCNGLQLDSCIVDNLNIILPKLETGWKEIDLPKLDPLELPPTINSRYDDGNMTLDLVLKDATIWGLSKTQVQLVKAKSITEGKLEVMCKTPAVSALGTYTTDGYMSFFPLHSEGHFNVTMSEVNSGWLIYIIIMTLNGTDYLQVDHLGLDVMPLEVTVQAAKQFDGDNKLGSNLNLFLNENAFELYKLLKSKIMSYFQDVFQIIINHVLLASPKQSILPDINIDL